MQARIIGKETAYDSANDGNTCNHQMGYPEPENGLIKVI